MPLGVATQFSDEEADQLEALRDPNETPLEADEEGPDNGQPTADDGGQVGSEQPSAENQSDNADATSQPQDKPKGDIRQALRASRRSEQRAKDELQRLREENEELRKQAPPKPAATDEITDAELDEISADFPQMAKLAAAVKRMAPKPEPKPQSVASTEFVPDELPPDLQEVVDDIPDLLTWQNDPDQTRFEMAKAADALLLRHPKWKDKPQAERLQEVARRVNNELGQDAPAAPQRIDPARAIEEAPQRQARSMGDIGGGGGRDAKANDLARFKAMSADDVEAELMTRG